MIKISTTFDVFPSTKYIPTFGELLEFANARLKEFLNTISIFDDVKIAAQLHKNDESTILDSVSDYHLNWDKDFYAWFFIEGIPGGTDAYFWYNDEIHKDILIEELNTNINMQNNKDKINRHIEIGYRWNFRRSAGQPGIIVLSYGLLSACLGKLTDGLIYSDDGAWDYSLFPATPDDFLKWYFKPEISNKHDDKIWAEECINSIYKEILDRNVNEQNW